MTKEIPLLEEYQQDKQLIRLHEQRTPEIVDILSSLSFEDRNIESIIVKLREIIIEYKVLEEIPNKEIYAEQTPLRGYLADKVSKLSQIKSKLVSIMQKYDSMQKHKSAMQQKKQLQEEFGDYVSELKKRLQGNSYFKRTQVNFDVKQIGEDENGEPVYTVELNLHTQGGTYDEIN